jgi:hypothetical protein
MTETAAPSAPPLARDRTSLALAGVVVVFALLNSIASLASWIWPDIYGDLLSIIAVAVLVFQPMMFGVWTALGAGSILTRLPIAVPCLMLLFIAPGYVPAYFADVRRKEFVVAVLVGFAIYAATLILFLVFRWFTGFRIQPRASQPSIEKAGISYSVKYLWALITVYAVALGLTTQLKFQAAQPPPNFIFGPDFFISILVLGGAIISAAALPTLAIPLAILHGRPSRRAVLSSIAFWIVVTLSAFVTLNDKNQPLETLGALLLAQFGAALAGALTALPLRVAGLQLVRYRPNTVQSPQPLAPSP